MNSFSLHLKIAHEAKRIANGGDKLQKVGASMGTIKLVRARTGMIPIKLNSQHETLGHVLPLIQVKRMECCKT